jgi:two-component system, chemotaxis family, CheB/CheR fusion protein
LRTALHQALDSGTPTNRRVDMVVDGIPRRLNVVRPAEADENLGRFALIVFNIIETETDLEVAPNESGTAYPDLEKAQLEEELNRTRELLESTATAHDRSVAELQTVNEELQSINEEQRAAGEELETGREEIQSINEELTAINQEHQSTIEELKRSNDDLQNLIESTEIGTIFLDRNMRVRRFTPAAAAIFNFTPSDQGRRLSDITHKLGYPNFYDDVERVLATLERAENEVESDSGTAYIVRINPYRSVDGANEGAVLTFFDSTAQHRASKELKEAKLLAESANMAKSTFLSTLSHEFRTPLNGILGYAGLLELDDSLTHEQQLKVDRIKAGGWHLTAMIDEILSFAKLDGGHETVDPEPIDARAIALEAQALIEPAAREKKLLFSTDVLDKPIRVFTDPDKTRQILLNLCGNAVKYTQDGQIRLSVRQVGDRIRFDVLDTGIGIAPAHIDKIFERFWQVSSGSTRAAGGMGIGLSAAREHARLLQGDVEVESILGQGTTFHFWLPLEYKPA